MDVNDLIYFGEELEKKSSAGFLRKIFFSRRKLPFKKRLSEAGSTLLGTAGITGAIGVGGTVYGGMTQSPSIIKRNPAKFRF